MSWHLAIAKELKVTAPKVFVETGAYMGNGIADALGTGHFSEVHSIELSPKWHAHCTKRFQNDSRVHMHLGDSAVVLEQLLVSGVLPADEPVLFYLDAHWSGGETAGEHVDNGCPVMRELEVLVKHRKRELADVIVVDDLRLMGKDSWSGGYEEIYPLTRFDFRHAAPEKMRELLSHKRVAECAKPDRLIFF